MIARAARHPLVWLCAWFLVIPPLMTAVGSTVSLGTEIVVFTLLAIAYNLLMGYTGLVSFGHSAFFAIGKCRRTEVAMAIASSAGSPINSSYEVWRATPG